MIQSNNTYSEIDLDETWKFKSFWVFKVNTLNELFINHIDQPWITEPTLWTQAIPWYTKLVWEVGWFNTRITQNETDINLLATDVNWNTAQININSTSITSLVFDVNWNTSSIVQNSTEINLRVTTTDFNSQIVLTEWKIALQVWDSADVKAQVVVDAVNGGTVNIDWQRINITWNVTFNSLQSQANTTESDLNILETNLWDMAFEDLVETAKLWTTIIQWWYIKTVLLDVDDIFAQTITATWTITWWNFVWWKYETIWATNDETVKLQYWVVEFLYDWLSVWYLKPWGLLWLTWITCVWDFAVTWSITKDLVMDTLFSSDIILQWSNNRIYWEDWTTWSIYYSSSQWRITQPATFNNHISVDSQITLFWTTAPVILFDWIALEKSWTDLLWNWVKIN